MSYQLALAVGSSPDFLVKRGDSVQPDWIVRNWAHTGSYLHWEGWVDGAQAAPTD